MQFELKNRELSLFFAVVERLVVRNMRANRGRAKLLVRLKEKFSEYHADELEIFSTYVVVDEAGNFCKDEAGNYLLRDPSELEELNSLLNELAEEEVVIAGGEYSERFAAFFAYLSESEEVFSGEEIVLLDKLLEQYEQQVETKGEEI